MYRSSDDTPVFIELLEAEVKSRRKTAAIIHAVYEDHYRMHPGPIMWCDHSACRLACDSRRAA
jgi:hypothetical protein